MLSELVINVVRQVNSAQVRWSAVGGKKRSKFP